MKNAKKLIFILVLIATFVTNFAYAARIKDIADIKGVRRNQLVGYGLIVGLNGTGDGKDAEFTLQSLTSMLEKMGVTVKTDDIEKAVDNVAAVMVTSELPPFAKSGSRIDVLVSSIGDAENLQGGTLLFTPLKGADGQVYAVAQGPVSTGGFSAGGKGGGVQKNFPTVGRIAGGAVIEREIKTAFSEKKRLTLLLHTPDFTTALRMTEAINKLGYAQMAQAEDSSTINIDIPENYTGNIVKLITMVEGLEVTPDAVAKVIINERTGTVVMGSNVRISTVAVAHGNLSIEIKESPKVSQPLPFAQGETVVTPDTEMSVKEGNNRLILMEPGVSIGEVVRALNALGVSPRDLIAIFQAMKAAGALQAELEII
ncbi:flagellar P-ring protein precursor FlgI [Desulfosarcina sp. BuS5]|uniref:flagellar basal body P-ring protein FlgI n=1 Tax=Desulfosarcina sp. BuS5 TaxID=933262 RepID=UPI000481A0D8|nr:flagellar basal body P-ring protein FlgI [Desulfosarcina sp. BuS5]WDN90017.1 flagellar P-ring protein precursor FlgI [Desulfosarcina sp. BuS5]